MSKFFIAIGDIKNKKNEIYASIKMLPSTTWDKLYIFERDDVYLSWTNSGDTVSFYKEDNDLILLVGNLFGVRDIQAKLKELLSGCNEFNYTDYLKGLDGSYFIVIKKNNSIILSNDAIASNPRVYHYHDTAGHFYSTDLKVLKHALNLTINPKGILEKIMCFSTVNNTYLNNVKVLESDIILNITSNGINRKKLSRIISAHNYENATEEELLIKLDGLWDRSMKGYNICNNNFALSLSGGLDSRFILGGMRKNLKTDNILILGFSTKRNPEHIIASKICKKLGLAHKTLYFSDFSFQKMERFIWQTEEIAVSDSVYYSEYIDFMHKYSAPVSNGFILDALSGCSFRFWFDERENYEDPSASFLEKSKNGIFKIGYMNEHLRNELEHDIYQGAKEVFDDIDVNYRTVHRKLELFNLLTLEKTWNNNIALAINLSGKGIIQAHNMDFINFWLDMPIKFTYRQKLYRNYMKKYLSDIAEIESTFDLQKISGEDSKAKNIIFTIKKQLNRMATTYPVPEIVINNRSKLYQFMMDNKCILKDYFKEDFINKSGHALKNRTLYNKIISKSAGGYFNDEMLVIPINIIIFYNMMNSSAKPLYDAAETIKL